MSYVHIDFPASPRKSYALHTSFLGFSAILPNDENVHTAILHWSGETFLNQKGNHRHQFASMS